MNTRIHKNEEVQQQQQAIGQENTTKQGIDDSMDFVDNSPEAIEMRAFQSKVDNSDETIQMKAYQDTINNTPEATEMGELQSSIDNSDEVLEMQNYQEAIVPDPTPNSNNQKNTTGIPDSIKQGIETLSGISMDDVKVHYNSSKPAEVGAHAYAEGTNVYLAPGQEEHLPHELWHIVQQKQGRVKATTNVNGKKVNDDRGLEKEADVMGGKVENVKGFIFEESSQDILEKEIDLKSSNSTLIQRKPNVTNNARVAFFTKKTMNSTLKTEIITLLSKGIGVSSSTIGDDVEEEAKKKREDKGKRGILGVDLALGILDDLETLKKNNTELYERLVTKTQATINTNTNNELGTAEIKLILMLKAFRASGEGVIELFLTEETKTQEEVDNEAETAEETKNAKKGEKIAAWEELKRASTTRAQAEENFNAKLKERPLDVEDASYKRAKANYETAEANNKVAEASYKVAEANYKIAEANYKKKESKRFINSIKEEESEENLRAYFGGGDIGDGGTQQKYTMSCGPTVYQKYVSEDNPVKSELYINKENHAKNEQEQLLKKAFDNRKSPKKGISSDIKQNINNKYLLSMINARKTLIENKLIFNVKEPLSVFINKNNKNLKKIKKNIEKVKGFKKFKGVGELKEKIRALESFENQIRDLEKHKNKPKVLIELENEIKAHEENKGRSKVLREFEKAKSKDKAGNKNWFDELEEDLLKKIKGFLLTKEVTEKSLNDISYYLNSTKTFEPKLKTDEGNSGNEESKNRGNTKGAQLSQLYDKSSSLKYKNYKGESSLNEISKALFLGKSVPFQGKYNNHGHYMIFSDIDGAKVIEKTEKTGIIEIVETTGKTKFLIDDPETGCSFWMTKAQILDSDFSVMASLGENKEDEMEEMEMGKKKEKKKEGYKYSSYIIAYDCPKLRQQEKK